jgi:hypothetical protein
MDYHLKFIKNAVPSFRYGEHIFNRASPPAARKAGKTSGEAGNPRSPA